MLIYRKMSDGHCMVCGKRKFAGENWNIGKRGGRLKRFLDLCMAFFKVVSGRFFFVYAM